LERRRWWWWWWTKVKEIQLSPDSNKRHFNVAFLRAMRKFASQNSG
jgi:hypothetical protein